MTGGTKEVKEKRLKARSKEWLGEKADGDMTSIQTAVLISNYVDGSNLGMMKKDLNDANSPLYKTEFDKHGKRGWGTLLYVRFVFAEYLDNSKESVTLDEKQLLDSIINSLAGLYAETRVDTGQRLDNLITGFDRWLTEYADKNPNRAQAQAACNSIYTVLKIIDISLQNIHRAIKPLIPKSLKIDVLKLNVSDLLIKTEEKIEALAKPFEFPSSTEPLAELNAGEALPLLKLKL